jgi:hypothetical protein
VCRAYGHRDSSHGYELCLENIALQNVNVYTAGITVKKIAYVLELVVMFICYKRIRAQCTVDI